MAKNFEHLIHKNSNVIIDGAPKLPTSSQIEYGELAVNYAKDKETISLKNSDNEIVTFSSDAQIQSFFKETEEIIANALNDINSRLGEGGSDVSEEIEELTTNFEELSLGTATALNDLNSRITTLTSDVDEIELGAASALNDLDKRITETNSSITELGSAIDEMDEVTASSLNDLNGRIINLEDDVETVAEELESDVDQINTRLTTLENTPSGDTNVIETVKVNGTALVPDANKAVNVVLQGLPTVTAADNGKILAVVDGAWALVSPSTIYTGTGTPSDSDGNNGDIYLQTT